MIADSRKRDIALVVDDSPETLRLLTDALDGAGMTVMVAMDGAAALRIVDQITPDIILLDAMMPDFDGATTLQALRANPKTAEIPVIFLTAKVQSSDRKRFGELGANAVLSKPFDPMTLGAQIAEALGWK